MNPFRTALITGFLLLTAQGAFAQLYFRNSSKGPVLAAYALKANAADDESWFTQGWYLVKPGERVMMNKTLGTFGLFYYYAQSADGTHSYDGTMRLLVHPSKKFLIVKPNELGTTKGNPEYQFRPFRVVRLAKDSHPKEYTIDFKG